MTHLQWKPEYSVHVQIIDNQHKHFIEILSRLYDAISERKTKDEINPILLELVKYADLHFATEEKYFDEFNYEKSDDHKLAHQAIKNQVLELSNKPGDHLMIALALVDLLEKWLVAHLYTMDKEYTACFNEHGLV